MTRKRERANSFIENCNKIDDNEELFDYPFYCNLFQKKCNNLFKIIKSKCKKDFISKNEILRLNDDYYYKQSEYQNIKFSPDCFSHSGDLIDIFVKVKDHKTFKENNIPKSYEEYVQIILNILNLQRCIIYVYHVNTYSNTREIRKSENKVDSIEYIINNENNSDIYWGTDYVTRLVINKNKKFDIDSIDFVNKKIFSINVDKYITPKTKKFKSERYLSEDWIAASKTRNFALDDPILDYCRAYNVKDIDDNPVKMINNFEPSSRIERKNKSLEDSTSFVDFLLTSGNKFEDEIINSMNKKFKGEIVKICNGIDSRNMKHFDETLNEMKKGTPIIYQAVMYNFQHKVFGSADLLIRSDYLNKVVNCEIISKDVECIRAPLLKEDYHYCVVDIKHSKLHLNTDAQTIRNNHNIKPFKTQIAIYNLALGEMQGYLPNQSYIIGNGWILNKFHNKKEIVEQSDDPFNKFGVIDLKNNDSSYYDKALDAVSWIKDLNNSEHFSHKPPNDDRLYPNMCNTYDGIYHKFKSQLANDVSEISSVWNCGYVNRLNAFKSDVKSWKSEKCNSKLLEIKGEKKCKIIDEMLNFNRKRDKIININKIDNNKRNWRSDGLTLYVDFETINSSLLNSSKITKLNIDGDYIFMIGIGWKEPNNRKWNYKYLITQNISLLEEKRILGEMIEIINDLNTKYNTNANVYHWSNAEVSIFNRVNYKYGNIFQNINWFDLLTFFKENNILILDCLNFSLKTIAKSMCKYGLIKSKWDTGLDNGLDAMFFSWREYLKKKNVENSDVFKSVIEYNEIDCKVLFEIHNYLKDNH